MVDVSRTCLLEALGEHETVNAREALSTYLGRVPTDREVSAARKAARRIAEDGDAVLMTLYPGQAEGSIRGNRAVLHLTVDHRVIKDLPCRVDFATETWDTVIDEGMRLTQQEIEADPMLSAMLPGWDATPRAEVRARAEG
jgi:hypothetical protein